MPCIIFNNWWQSHVSFAFGLLAFLRSFTRLTSPMTYMELSICDCRGCCQLHLA